MTTVASIIQSAFRETNLTPLGVLPNTDQQTEAFGLLQVVVASVLGNDAGENMLPLPLGKNTIKSPAGYPWWNNSLPGNVYVPTNTRLMCNLTGPGTVNLDPAPRDGARMGVIDVSQDFDLYPLTINGNGRSIEGQASMTYSTRALIKEWLYREDLGNWVVVTPLTLTGDMPFPSDHDDMFIIMLAMRLNPRYGQTMHPASIETLKDAKMAFNSRYRQSIEVPSEVGLTRLTNAYSAYGRNTGHPNSSFNSGVVY